MYTTCYFGLTLLVVGWCQEKESSDSVITCLALNDSPNIVETELYDQLKTCAKIDNKEAAADEFQSNANTIVKVHKKCKSNQFCITINTMQLTKALKGYIDEVNALFGKKTEEFQACLDEMAKSLNDKYPNELASCESTDAAN